MTELNDTETFDKVITGDFIAFKSLFDKYYEPLCHYALNFTRDTYLAEDAVQEVFIKIWEKKRKMKFTRSVKSYFYTAVKNKCLDKLKSERIRSIHSTHFFEREDKFISLNEIEYDEFSFHLSECVEKLPSRCKEVFTWSRFHNMKQEKIASEMGISLKTVKAQIGKALKLIRDCINTSYPEYL